MDVTNDDEQERRNRRRSRAADLLFSAPATEPGSAEAAGPSGSSGAPHAGPLLRMTAKELTEHYEDCIKLSAEGKISAKNAFALHLIDYLEGLVKRDKIDSFQVASSSLDAGAKIYAGRVDAVHQEAYKVLGGLGRSSALDKKKASDDDEAGGNSDDSGGGGGGGGDGGEDGEDGRRGAKRRERKRRAKAVIATNLTRIRLKPASLRFDVDPLFQQQAAAYDDGGTGELRLNNVRVLDNACEILLDSDAPVCVGSAEADVKAEPDDSQLTQLVPVAGQAFSALATVARDPLELESEEPPALCLAFRKFSFLRRGAGGSAAAAGTEGEDGGAGVGDATRADQSAVLADFIARLPPTPPKPAVAAAASQDRHDAGDNDNDEDNMGFDDNYDDGGGGPGDVGHGGGGAVEVAIGCNREGVVVQPTEESFRPNASRNFVDALREMLSDRMQFSVGPAGISSGGGDLFRLGMWAGPGNWKRKCKLTALSSAAAAGAVSGVAGSAAVAAASAAAAAAAASQAMPPPPPSALTSAGAAANRREAANKAAAAQLLADNRPDWQRVLAQVRTGHKLTDAVIRKCMLKPLDLPPVNLASSSAGGRNSLLRLTADNRQSLHSASGKDHHQQQQTPVATGPGSTPLAPNDDAEDPGADDRAEDDDADLSNFYDHGGAAGGAGDLDMGAGGQTVVDQPFADAFFSQAAGTQQQQQQLMPQFPGSSQQPMPLLQSQQPYKVNQLDIAYAKTAKRINISRLKQSMWQLLKTDGQAASESPKEPQSEFAGERSFAQLLQRLPPKVGATTAQDLSVSIVFSCLLYLANEKTLHLVPSDDLSDMSVAFGLPQHEVDLRKALNPQLARQERKRPQGAKDLQPRKRQSTIKELWGDDSSMVMEESDV